MVIVKGLINTNILYIYNETSTNAHRIFFGTLYSLHRSSSDEYNHTANATEHIYTAFSAADVETFVSLALAIRQSSLLAVDVVEGTFLALGRVVTVSSAVARVLTGCGRGKLFVGYTCTAKLGILEIY